MQVIGGVESRGFTSRSPSLRRLGAAAKLWASNWGGQAGGLRGGGSAPTKRLGAASLGAARAGSGSVWRPRVQFRLGRARGPGVCVWGCVGGRGRGPERPAVAARRWRFLTLALRCSRSWLPAAALTPEAPPGAALAPRAPAAGQQVAAASLPPNRTNAA